MDELLKIIGLAAFSGIKFAFAVPAILLAGYSYWETILITVIGGMAGFIAFFYFGEFLKSVFNRYFPQKNKKKIFSKKNRRIITIKGKYGLIGLSLLTPAILSIPLGSLLAARYFDKDKRTLPYMSLSIVIWAFVFTTIFHLF